MGKKHPWEQRSPRRGQMTGAGRNPATPTQRTTWAVAWARNATWKGRGFKPREVQRCIQLLCRAVPQHAQQKPLAKSCSLFRSVGSRSHCNLSPSFHGLLINQLLTAVVSQIQLNRKSTDLVPHLTACSFVKLFNKAKLPSWTEILAALFPWKSCRVEDQILPLLNSLQDKFRHLHYIPFIYNKHRICKASPSAAHLWTSCRRTATAFCLLSTKITFRLEARWCSSGKKVDPQQKPSLIGRGQQVRAVPDPARPLLPTASTTSFATNSYRALTADLKK